MKTKGNSDAPVQQKSKKIKATHQIQSSITPIPTLPYDIITEILSRLPVKSVLKFKCVSKSWCSLISSPKFIKTHLDISMKDADFTHHGIMFTISNDPGFQLKHCSLRSLLYEPSSDAVTISFPRKIPHRSVWVVGSCNGLICISINETDLFLWNPSVRKSKKLPDLGVDLRRGVCIAYGFGFDEANDDYKVVGIFFGVWENPGRKFDSMVKVYSLKANSWRRIGDFNGRPKVGDSGKFAQGKLHWYVTSGVDFSTKSDIVSLDVERETYGMVEQPNYGEGVFDLIIGVLGGLVCVLCNYQETRADVWVLKEYGVKESWSKLFSIPYFGHIGNYRYSIPLCILPHGEFLLVLGSSFIIYNSEKSSFRFLKMSNMNDLLGADIYVESLLSPADGGAGRQRLCRG